MEEKNKKGFVAGIKDGFKDIIIEYKKISWPKRDLLIKQTGSVIAFSFLIGSVVLVYDLVYNFLFSFIVR